MLFTRRYSNAFENGYTLATHFYSGMSGVTRRDCYRYAGVIESGYLIDEMSVEVIADGIHLPAPLLKLIYKIIGPDRIALITDSMRGAGSKKGTLTVGKDADLVIFDENIKISTTIVNGKIVYQRSMIHSSLC